MSTMLLWQHILSGQRAGTHRSAQRYTGSAVQQGQMRCWVAWAHGQVFKLPWASSSASSDGSEPHDQKCMHTHAPYIFSLSSLTHIQIWNLGTEKQNTVALRCWDLKMSLAFTLLGWKTGQRHQRQRRKGASTQPKSSQTIHSYLKLRSLDSSFFHGDTKLTSTL